MSAPFTGGPRRLARQLATSLTAVLVVLPALPAAAAAPVPAAPATAAAAVPAAVPAAAAAPAPPAVPAAPAAPAPAASSADGDLHRIVVAYADDRIVPAAVDPDATVTGRIDPLGVQVLEVAPEDVDAVLERMQADDRVRWAEPDVPVQADAVTPRDPLWPQQWGPRLVGSRDAWAVTRGSSTITVAILDSGVDAGHPDLRGAVLPGRSFVPGVTSTADDNGHGTSAAGIVAARGNDGVGIAGMCWECRILPVKVLDERGSGTMSAVAQGLVWAADQGAQVASLSLSSTGTSQAISDAVAYARGKGMLVFASAGNAGTTAVRYPAALPGVISVAGTTDRDARYDWSTYGSWVDLAAPGCNLTTRRGGGHAAFCGTSSATPLVAGAAALGLSVSTSATASQVADALVSTATPVSFSLGGGRVRVDAAVARLSAVAGGAGGGSGRDVEREPTSRPAPEPAASPARPITRACPAATASSTAAGIGAHGVAATCLDAWNIGIFPLADYQASQALTRAEFAALLDRMLDATGDDAVPASVVRFRDVTGHPHRHAIERLAGLGIIAGFADGGFAPDRPIRRDQMATLMARVATSRYGATLSATTQVRFVDVAPGAAHAEAIAQLAAAGVTTGTGPGTYDPAGMVTRGQTATFTARLLDLLVDEGHVAAQVG